ncbi:hypothetical protein EC988_008708 [Linderina pennispora]|nr:hypothetical protein EC988_008708 [Linderina pennispora]
MMIDEKIKPGMYDVTGTELLTFNQVAQIACKVFGKDIKFEKDNGQELTEYLRQHGDVCNNEIALIIDILEAVSRGWLSMKTDTLKRMLGREPMTFSSYLEHNADDFQPKADSD